MYWRNPPSLAPIRSDNIRDSAVGGIAPYIDRSIHEGWDFVKQDRLLDRAGEGPTWLREPEIARCVMDGILEGVGAEYDLQAFVVMPNHVHILITPGIELAKITRRIKGKSARRANAILRRTGRPFWQDESFDHWIRDSRQFEKVRTYTERNPVDAGLVNTPEQWPYSSYALDLTG